VTRQTERIILGVLGFLCAVIVLFVGIRLATGGDSNDVAANSLGTGVDSAMVRAEDGPEGLTPGDGLDDGSESSLTVTSSTAVPTSESSARSSSESTTTTEASTTSETSNPDSSSTSSTVTSTSTTVGSSSTSASSSSSLSLSSSTSTTLAESSSSTTESTTSSTNSTMTAGLTAVEQEIIRLTNQLRTDPSGPLRRGGPTPECVLNSADIVFDPDTGHPEPVPALTVSEAVSLNMSRDWSQRMADADAMSHRSAASQDAIYSALGIDWAARGENVAWAVGYNANAVAQLFFNGWRESAGHYCNMVSSAFTHVGVGHVRTAEGKDFATQNFYRPQ